MILAGDFLQMKAFGTAICNSLCITVTADDVNCRSLISEFDVFHIEEQVRSKCDLHKRCLKKFRALPTNYPTGASWSAKEKKEFKIVDDEIMSVVTNELNASDMEKNDDTDSSWADAPILTNNNLDRIAINHVRAKSFAEKNNQIVIMWRKEISTKTFQSQ